MLSKKHYLTIFTSFFTFITICINAWHAIRGDMIFDIDVARDFLLMKEIVENHHIMLIGARSGAIMGVFHGPLWLYTNLPAFILGQGNPEVIGWFWFLLYLLLLFITFITAKKLFDSETACLSTLLVSSLITFHLRNVTNPFGTVIFSPIFFYFLVKYIKGVNVKDLLIALFSLGLIIQFEMAFGVPILLLTTIYLAIFLYKKHTMRHLFSFAVMLIPLSTYIVFDLVHHFLQFQAVIQFLLQKREATSLLPFLLNRLQGFTMQGIQLALPQDSPVSQILNLLIFLTLAFVAVRIRQTKHAQYRVEWNLFYYFYVGFWIVSLLFKSDILWYYYWAFLPLIAIFFSFSRNYIVKPLFYTLFSVIIACNIYNSLRVNSPADNELVSWKFQHQLAQDIFQKAPSEFGYFINTLDQVSSSPPLYAMMYAQSQNKQIHSYPFEKKPNIYLIIGPYPDGRPLDNAWWKENRVHINANPIEVKKYTNGVVVEKYLLSGDNLTTAADSTIFESINYR